MPTWLGDCVMATPTLRALRGLYPQAHITALVKSDMRPIVDATPWLDRILTIRSHKRGRGDARRRSMLRLAGRLAAGRFDLAVLLPNSFRTALLTKMAKIPRRVGYDRDGRGFLLTDRLLPRRSSDGYIPVPTREYFLGLARYLGAVDPDPTMELFTRPQDDRAAQVLLAKGGYQRESGQRLVLINPGASFGDAKRWLPDRFAAVADRCVRELGAAVALIGSPRERPVLDQVLAAAKEPLIDLPRLGLTLGTLKSIVRSSSLLITNDTGPRHVAAALGVPVVTIFGPTDPAWTEIGFALERQVMVSVFCGPCQRKVCPLDHRCMTRIDAEMVFTRVGELWSAQSAQRGVPSGGSEA